MAVTGSAIEWNNFCIFQLNLPDIDSVSSSHDFQVNDEPKKSTIYFIVNFILQ